MSSEPKSGLHSQKGFYLLRRRLLIHCRPIFVKVMQLDYHLPPKQSKILMQLVLLRGGNFIFAQMARIEI